MNYLWFGFGFRLVFLGCCDVGFGFGLVLGLCFALYSFADVRCGLGLNFRCGFC